MKARKIRRNSGLVTQGGHYASEGLRLSVLDTAHLDAQVGGDLELREEVLRLYTESLAALLPALDGKAGRVRQEAAHKLKGASLAIGAFALARLCEALEREASAGVRNKPSAQDETRPTASRGERLRRDVARAIEATRRRIDELLRADRG